MSERDIFTIAREMTDTAARSAYLDGACDGDAGLKARVEALLRAHDQPDSLLDHPAVAPQDHVVGDSRTLDHQGEAPADDEPLTFLTPSSQPDSLGRLGHYEVLQALGRGGFGIVFRAFDETLQRVVALKVMAPQLAATSPARKRFLREARSSAQVRHENVVQVYEVAEQPLPYLAMEFIPGETLQQRLDRVGPLDVVEVLRVGRQIAEGLAAAHATDLIHRDIKPGNVLLEGGQHKVKITDFGLARAADDASISQSGIIAGTPMYMAPEQAQGQTLDQRADLFSLGSVLYQMVAGRPPFRANTTVAVLKRVAEDKPRAIREIIPETPQWLCDIIAKLHAKNPDDRYQSAREVADVLADCEAQLKANAKLKDYSRIPRSKPQRSGRRKWVAVAAAALLLALAGAWFGRTAMLYFSDRGEMELLPEAGLVSVIVLQNNEGVLEGDKLHAPMTDWLDMKKSHTLSLPPGRYQLNVGTSPAGTQVSQWEVTTSGPLGSNVVAVPVINSSAIVTLERGRRTTLHAKLSTNSPRPAPIADTSFGAKQTQEASAKQLGIPVETTNSIGIKLRLIPPGKFTMGSTKEEIDYWVKRGGNDWMIEKLLREGPEHAVELTQPFYMGQTDVTVGQFRQFVQATAYQMEGGGWHFGTFDAKKNWLNPGFAQTDDHPVVCVSWNDAAEFCNWLSKKEGKHYRLPTEAEWEYSCRAGSKGRWSFGDNEGELLNYARFYSNSQGHAWPVAGLKPNAWGLHDMHGNVFDWCQDWYDANYYKISPRKDPPGASAGSERVLRGGSWCFYPGQCRSAFRVRNIPGARCDDDGFRVVLAVSSSAGAGTESMAKNKPAVPAAAPLKYGDPEYTNTLGMKLKLIPAGKFTMGSPKEEIDRCLKQLKSAWLWENLATEGPEHLVDITQPFYLGATEVTVGQFRQFVDEEGYQVGDSRWRNPGFDQTDQHPVVWVSWNNAVDFCKWLSKKEVKEYRLPTEAEWEYSCRAGKAGSRYGFGDDDAQLENYAWFNKNSRGGTHPVGKKKPNAWGLYDMHGNAGELCQDNWDPNYYKSSPVKDPPGGAGGARAGRGGAWNFGPVICRSAFRGFEGPDQRWDFLGFRVVLAVAPSAGARTESVAKGKTSSTAITPFTDADVQRIAALPAAQQVEEVRRELKRRNPGFDGKMETKIEGGIVTEFRIVTDKVTDIAPIRVFDGLRVLECTGSLTNDQPNGQLADLTPLKEMNLSALTYLVLWNTKVGDAGMAYFKDCNGLTGLGLNYTNVSNAGLVYFKNCKGLMRLGLEHTKVSDAGLANFKECKNLILLWLPDAQVGDAGMAHFQDCKALTDLNLAGTKVSDVGLAHFKDCKNLKNLYLDRTQVSDAGLAHFKGMRLTALNIDDTAITDLTPLQGMPLEHVCLTPKNITRGLDILRAMKSLKTIGIRWDQGWPAAEFWERYDRGEFK